MPKRTLVCNVTNQPDRKGPSLMARRSRVEFIECKTFGHAWDEYNPPAESLPDRTFDRIALRCTRCTTTRHDHFDKSGEMVARRYSYPDGYRTAADDKPSRAALRLMLTGHRVPRGVQ